MKWILHDNIGYIFPGQQQIILKTDTVEGAWNEVTSRMSPERIKAPLFRIWLDHGIDPVNKSYSYIIVPNATEAAVKRLVKKEPFILVNEKTRQEVISASGNTAGIVFYEPGKSAVFGGIEADQPCLVMIKRDRDKLQVSVADPTQLLSEVNISLNGFFSGDKVEMKNGKALVKILFPTGWEAGKTVTIYLNFKKLTKSTK